MKYYYVKSLEKVLSKSGCRELILYKRDGLSEIIYKNLLYMGRDIKYFISDSHVESSFCNKEVRGIKSLLQENHNNVYILVFAMNGHADVYEALLNMGYVYEKEFCLYSFGGYCGKFDAIDSLLGFNRKYETMWGFKVYGDSNSANIKIMTLGGSHSDPTMGNYKSWPELLYEKASKKYNIVLYSGGLAGYSVNQELMKFIRDGLALKPDILITFDGYTDAGFNVSMEKYPYLHKYQYKFYNYIQERKPLAPDTLEMRNPEMVVHGLENMLNDTENWITTIRKIHAIAAEFEIQHYSFFQPMLQSGNAIIDESINWLIEEFFKEHLHYKKAWESVREYVTRCQKEIKKYSYITDMTDIFDGEEDVYCDHCHSTDKGNNIIMEHIYAVIENALNELKNYGVSQ